MTKKTKKPQQEPLTYDNARKWTETTTYLQAVSKQGIPFPRVRVTTIAGKPSWWTPHLKEYVLQHLRQGIAGVDAIQEWVKHGNGDKNPQYIAKHLVPNPFQAMQAEPDFRAQYRDAIHDNKYRLEEQLLTGKMITDSITSYESYGSKLIDPSSVKLAALRTQTAIRCLQSIDRITWAQQKKNEEAQERQRSFQLYIPKRESNATNT